MNTKDSLSVRVAVRLLVLLTALTVNFTSLAQECPSGQYDLAGAEKLILERDLKIGPSIGASEWLDLKRKEDPQAVNGRQNIAPDANGGSSLTAAAEFARSLAFALDQRFYQEASSPRITLNLGAKTLAELFSEPGEETDLPRRFGLSTTLGGSGVGLDSDLDGETEEPLAANNLGDIVSYELRIQLLGFRDFDTRKNREEILNEQRQALEKLIPRAKVADLPAEADTLMNHFQAQLKAMRSDPAIGCHTREQVDRAWTAVLALTAQQAAAKVSEKLRKRSSLSLAAGGTKQGEEFGPDKFYAELRFDRGMPTPEGEPKSEDGLAINLNWTKVEKLVTDPMSDIDTFAASASYSLPFPRPLRFLGAGLGKTRMAFAAKYTYYDKLPAEEEFESQAELGLTWKIPLSPEISLPLGIRWVNHPELLGTDDKTFGHVGIQYDFDALLPNSGNAEGS